jgi:hypothetical protein
MESEILGSRSGGCGRHCIIHSGSGILPVIAGIVLHALLGPSGIARMGVIACCVIIDFDP